MPEVRLQPATAADDAEFAHDLTRLNMQGYVARHWGEWSREIFFANYAASENWLVHLGAERIGLLRLDCSPPTLTLHDLQVLPAQQNKGHGRAVLGLVAGMARERSCATVRLRVFDENPARRLYERVGFAEVGREGDAAWLEWPIG